MKKLATIAMAAGLFALTGAAHAMRIAYVDVKKVFEAYNGTQTAKDQLKRQVDDEKAKVTKDGDDLKKAASDLESKKSVLAPAKYKEQQQALQDKYNDLQKRLQSVSEDLQQKEAKMTSQIVDLIKEATATVAKDQKYDFVFESSNLLFGGDEITSSVIKEVNSK